MANFEPSVVAVIGLGYVGSVTAACLGKLGHRVIGVDRDQYKIDQVNRGEAPFHEPGLGDLFKQCGERVSATLEMAEGIGDADVALICVGTPSQDDGSPNLDQIRRVCEEIRPLLDGRARKLIVAIRSTVFPGTCEEVVVPALGNHPCAEVASNPEFLREGTAIKDFVEPSLLVVGSSDEASGRLVAGLYAPLPVEPCFVSLRTAELIKFACNAFHATKISFANEIGSLAARLDIDPSEVMDTLCRDEKLNVSRAYLRPGFAFGGSCLPKDLRALNFRASRLGLDLPLLASTLPSNQAHLDRAVEAVLALPAHRIGVFGLAFKDKTDDMRESPVLTLIERVLAAGREIRVFDPHIRTDSVYGSNLAFLLERIPDIGKWMVPTPAELGRWAEHLILTQHPAADAESALTAAGKPTTKLFKLEKPA